MTEDIRKGCRYRILKYPRIGSVDLMWVKVVGVHVLPSGKRIVSYRYNQPFPITDQATFEDFASWVTHDV